MYVSLTEKITNCLPWKQSSSKYPSTSAEQSHPLLLLWSRGVALDCVDPPDTSVVQEPHHKYYKTTIRYQVMKL